MLAYDPSYLQYGHQNIFKLKSIQCKNCSEFQNLQLYYIVQFQIQSAFTIHPHKYLCRIHSTYNLGTKISLRKKVLNTKITQNFKILSFATQQNFEINDNQKYYNQKHQI
jgi:hypothetical protein